MTEGLVAKAFTSKTFQKVRLGERLVGQIMIDRSSEPAHDTAWMGGNVLGFKSSLAVRSLCHESEKKITRVGTQ